MAGKASGVIGLATTLGATAVAKKAIDATWKIGAGKKPPTDPTDPDVQMREAMLWAVLSGAAVGAAKMWASRRVAKSARNDQKVLAAVRAVNG
jgi:hypothetical protein